MIGADESTVCNDHGCVIIVRRGANREQECADYRAEIERAGISMKLPADEIRRLVGLARKA